MAFPGYDFLHHNDHPADRLSRQIAGLSRDAGHISEALRRFGGNVSHDAGHYAGEFADRALHQGALASRVIGKQAWRAGKRAGKAVSRDPVPAVVAVAGLACLLSLVMSSASRGR